jgi:hypothetical protein
MDASGITALAQCAYRRERDALKRLFYDHIDPHSSIGVGIKVRIGGIWYPSGSNKWLIERISNL